MKAIKYLYGAACVAILLSSCSKDSFDDISFVNTAQAPDKISAMFDITQDNTGLVTIIPNGEGVVAYDVYFGDTNTAPARVAAGASIQHTYAEGLYDVKLVGYNATGKTTEATQKLTVSFKAPEDVEVTAAIDAGNNFKVNVSAKANYETLFKVYFGDVADEVPQSFLEGETVSHVYASVGTYTVKVVALSGGVATTESTTTVTIVDPVLLPLTFESTTLVYNISNFDGGATTIVANPNSGGVNTSTKVGKMVKGAGQPWGGSVLKLSENIDFSVNKIFRMKVYSPRVGAKVLLKVENAADGSISHEKEVATTKANEWEDLAFDYSGVATDKVYNNVVLIFDNGTMGDGSANFTWLFDDIRLTNNLPSTALTLPVTFDDPAFSYQTIDFGNNATEDANDPTNAGNKVKKTTKANGAETWAGTTIGTANGFASAIPFTASATKMSIRVYSPAAGIPIRLKVESHSDGTKSVETETNTTLANAWETLVFDFSNNVSGTPALNLSTAYDKASIFFDFGQSGNGKVFYWDDVKFVSGAASSVNPPLDFESGTLNYAFTDFDGGAVSIIANPQANGINTSGKVGKMVKGAGQPWGGSYLTLDNVLDFSTKKTFKMKVFSPRVGAKVLLKVENKTDGSISFEKEVSTTKANEWEILTFDYSAIDASKSYQKIILIFDLGTVGDGSANYTWLFDDITLN
ncbi:hypothetical protein [Pelobium manganitolerans]|uniref:hypothetical protein n=1 Tax=Pelobium manganitolerans TaxID=1842495 RepID=UPI003FA3B334